MEESLEKSFLLSLFKGATAEVTIQEITHMLIKQAGLKIPNLDLSAWENLTDSCVVTGHMVASLCGWKELKTGDHAMLLREV